MAPNVLYHLSKWSLCRDDADRNSIKLSWKHYSNGQKDQVATGGIDVQLQRLYNTRSLETSCNRSPHARNVEWPAVRTVFTQNNQLNEPQPPSLRKLLSAVSAFRLWFWRFHTLLYLNTTDCVQVEQEVIIDPSWQKMLPFI